MCYFFVSESPHTNDVSAPPKKRRLARESVSSEQSFTPPTTPTRPNQNPTVGTYCFPF